MINSQSIAQHPVCIVEIFEVKIGRDIQSQAQKDYQQAIERANGIYFIAKDFAGFMDWYNLNFKEGDR